MNALWPYRGQIPTSVRGDMEGLQQPFFDPVDVFAGPASVARKIGIKAFAGIPLDILASIAAGGVEDKTKNIPGLNALAPIATAVGMGYGGGKIYNALSQPETRQAIMRPLANDRGLWTVYGGNPDATQGQFSALHDRVPRVEIDDSDARIRIGNLIKSEFPGVYESKGTLGDILDHPALFEQHPELAQIGANIYEGKSMIPSGSYQRASANIDGVNIDYPPSIFVKDKNTEGVKSTLLHEIQHALQERGGMAKGGSPGEVGMWRDRKIELDEAVRNQPNVRAWINEQNALIDSVPEDQLDAALAAHAKKAPAELKAQWQDRRPRNFDVMTPNELYRNLAGEIEARDAAARMNMSAEQRRRTQPYSSENIPINEWIIRK